ncbi:DUF6348 family protein [Fusobacterium sp.]|uniref:DUF6348 family protein n=1 Tax=Fusobacterium sp. TaxID=68766 RepID=UPI00260801C4|nr:DUF6348 family protein [Fusobacterium sp.]
MERDFRDIPIEDLNYYLLENMKNTLEERCEIRDNMLFIPGYSLYIRPKVVRAEEGMAIIRYFLFSENWDREIFETCASFGKNRKNSLHNAEANFIYGILTGIKYISEKREFENIITEYNGKHSWKLYRGDIVGMGNSLETEGTDTDEFWNVIKDEMPKYMGNQKIIYIKVFGSKNGEEVICECRINDEPIKELGNLIEESVKRWGNKKFISKKQFFFVVQDEETYTPYPYSDDELRKYILDTAYTFDKCELGQEYDNLIMKIGEKINDYDLAEELIGFMPEICAERAFPDLVYPEKITLYFGDRGIGDYTKSQITSYYKIKKILNEEIDKGNILNDLYHKYIAVSSIYSVICQAKADGVDLLKEKGSIALCYGFSEYYKLR